MATFYQLDSSRVTVKEMAWGSKNPIVLLIGILLKLFRIKIPSSSDDSNVDSTLSFVVEHLPESVQQKFSSLTQELLGLGFCDPVYHVIEDYSTQTQIYWATFRHASGQHCARIHHRYWGKAQQPNRALFPMFITSFMDGTFLVSSSGKPDVAGPEYVQMNRMPKASIATLWSSHEQLAHQALAEKAIYTVISRESVVETTERLHVLQRDFHLARGFFRARTAEEEQQAAASAGLVTQAREAGTAFPEIMAELTNLQIAKPRWNSAIVVLAVSLGIFMATGQAQWSWKTTLILVPILLFHETGHWVAMRIFKYRNLRMFFIPFFGAAVTGRNWNVSGWKKALVSLAGPLPGIALGVVLAIVGTITGKDPLKHAALMLVLLNGFNLLPVLPLDGGHCLHALLFCRNRWLDIVFRGLAVAALLVLSAFGMGRAMMFIGIGLAISLPVAFKMARLTDHFRKRSFAPPLPGEDKIPAGIAEELVAAVKSDLPGKANNKMIAQHALNVYETLNARPPGIFATLGLLALHGAGFLAAVLCAVFLFLNMKGGGFSDFFRAAVRQPHYTVVCADTDVWRGASGSDSTQNSVNLIVSSFKNGKDAKVAYEQTTAKAPENATVMLFGSSLLMKLPASDSAAREKWFDEMQRQTTNTFVIVSNNAVTMSFMFIAPTEQTATNLENDLNDFWQSTVATQIVAPWEGEAQSGDFERYRAARRTWRYINKEMGTVWADPRIKEISRKISAANRRGARDVAQRLEEEEKATLEEVKAAKRQRMAAQFKNTAQAALVDVEVRLSELSYTNKALRAEITKELAAQLGRRSEALSTQSFLFGGATRHGLMVDVPFLTLSNPEQNLPLLMDWLCRQKCSHFKYEFADYALGGSDQDEFD